jgi:hypothetical protein
MKEEIYKKKPEGRIDAEQLRAVDMCPRAFFKFGGNTTARVFVRLVANVRAGKGN